MFCIIVTFEVSQKLMSELNEFLFANKLLILVTRSVVQRFTLPLLICEAIVELSTTVYKFR